MLQIQPFSYENQLMTVLLAILFSFCSVLPVFPDDLAHSEESLARIWTDRAAELLEIPTMDNLTAAKNALDVAEEFFPPGPDAQYLMARILNSNVRQAEALARESLDYEQARQFHPRTPYKDRALQYSLLALQLKNYSALLKNYESWPPGHKDSILLIYATARAALYLGLNEKAIKLAIRGESLATEQDSLSVFGLELDNPLPSFRAIAIAAGDEKSINTMESALDMWGESLEKAIMPWILTGIMGNRQIQKIHALLNPENKALADALAGIPVNLIIPHPEKDYLNLARRLGISNEKDGIVSFNVEPSGVQKIYTGKLMEDSNYDGFL